MAKQIPVTRQKILRELTKVAFGRANDCVKLAMDDLCPVEGLDLTLLSEVKRSKGGVVEVKLLDRLKALELLDAMVSRQDGEESPLLLQLLGGEEEP